MVVLQVYICFRRWGYYGILAGLVGVWRNAFARTTTAILCIHMSAMTWPKARIPNLILDACDVIHLMVRPEFARGTTQAVCSAQVKS
jgi:hypothetical protein